MKKIVVALMFGVALLWANEVNRLVLEEKCEANDAEACFKLGGKIEKACDLGLAEACMSIREYKKACDLGNVKGCKEMLSRMHGESEETRELYKKYCLNDAIESMCLEGIHKYGVGEALRNELAPKLIEILSKKCDDGEVGDCAYLGKTYLDGTIWDSKTWANRGVSVSGVDKDLAKAREFFQKACDFGDTDTCKEYQLTQDTSKFKAILQKACDSGNQNACPRLGGLYYEEGKSAGKDTAKAKELYQKACDLNSADGCYKLAVYYNVGRGVSQDINKAKELYKKACDLGDYCGNFKRLSK